jgi:hypothetical protein
VIGQVLDASGLDATVIGSVEATSWLITAHAASTPLYLPALAVSEVRSLRPDLLDAVDEVLDHPSAVYRPLIPRFDPGFVPSWLRREPTTSEQLTRSS